jgi:hypothetical protein
MNAKQKDEKKYHEIVYTSFPYDVEKKKIYLYNNTLTTFIIAYVPDADYPMLNTIKLQTTYVEEIHKIGQLKCGEYLVIKKIKENKYSDFVHTISESENEVRERKKHDDEPFYNISVNEFDECQKDDRVVTRIVAEHILTSWTR